MRVKVTILADVARALESERDVDRFASSMEDALRKLPDYVLPDAEVVAVEVLEDG